MNSKDCLTEQELTLHYYGELDASRSRHLADCQQCTEHLGALTTELAGLPRPDCTADALAGVRMAARVTEQLTNRRRRRWLPALGAGAVAALALVDNLLLQPATGACAGDPVITGNSYLDEPGRGYAGDRLSRRYRAAQGT